jgi:hypothetical protein
MPGPKINRSLSTSSGPNLSPKARGSSSATARSVSSNIKLNVHHISSIVAPQMVNVELNWVFPYQATMIQKVSTIAGWLALAFIAYVTLSPIDARPVIAGPQFERFAAFAVVGLMLGLAYPRRISFVVAIVAGSAFALEALQLLTPDRHGHLLDAAVKAAGGVCGIGIAQLGALFLRSQFSRAG